MTNKVLFFVVFVLLSGMIATTVYQVIHAKDEARHPCSDFVAEVQLICSDARNYQACIDYIEANKNKCR